MAARDRRSAGLAGARVGTEGTQAGLTPNPLPEGKGLDCGFRRNDGRLHLPTDVESQYTKITLQQELSAIAGYPGLTE